jgi:hypothetical protein
MHVRRVYRYDSSIGCWGSAVRCSYSAIRLSFRIRGSRLFGFATLIVAAFIFAAPASHGQITGRSGINDRSGFDRPKPKPAKPSTPPPRAISVLEWTPDIPEAQKSLVPAVAQPVGTPASPEPPKPLPAAANLVPAGKDIPKTARLIPVSIYYLGAFQDAGVFLSQPTPLALQASTVYDLEKAGDPAGTFTLVTAAHQQDSWLGFGTYKPEPPPKPFKPNVPNAKIVKVPDDDEDSDRPVLKRRSASDDSGAGSSGDTKNSASTQAPPDAGDPDRPVLKRPAPATPAPATPASASPTPAGAEDPDRPKLEHKPASKDSVSNPRSNDDYLNPSEDPNRPRIRRGVFRERLVSLPELLGNPENIRQTVAVSDAGRSEEHPFTHVWNDDAERDRTRDAMQKLALQQLAAWQKANPAPNPAKAAGAQSHVARTSTPVRSRKTAQPAVELTAIQFAGYDLAYQDEPTYVFAAQTAAPGLDQKFLAIVARPDIYGVLQIVFSAVTDGSHLALTPRYRLVDAVDADGDGRAELLLEARNLDGRRFVLLDVYRGAANKVFETGLLP